MSKIISAEQFLIEHYNNAIEKVSLLEKELKEKNVELSDLKGQLGEDVGENENITVLPTLMLLYSIQTSSHYIKKENVEQYEEQLKKREINRHNDYYIIASEINAIITIASQKFFCNVSFKGRYSNQSIQVFEIERYYKTEEEALDNLMKKLEKDIAEKKKGWESEE